MKVEEAIKRIQDIITYNGLPIPTSLNDIEALNLAIKALEERPQGVWIDYSEEDFIECPFCHKATTCEDNIDELHYCWICGAKLMKGGAE